MTVKNQLIEKLNNAQTVVNADGERLDPVIGVWCKVASSHMRSPLPQAVITVVKRDIRREVFCPGTDEDKIATAIYNWFNERAEVMDAPSAIHQTRAELKKKTEEVDRRLLSVLSTYLTYKLSWVISYSPTR